jgi:hypothetical protein
MPESTRIEIPPCPHCGHTWSENLQVLDQSRQIIFRGPEESSSRNYRVCCPKCNTHFIITIDYTEDDHA